MTNYLKITCCLLLCAHQSYAGADSVKIQYACKTVSTLDLMTGMHTPNSEIKIIAIEIIDNTKVFIKLNPSQIFLGKNTETEIVGEDSFTSSVMQKKEKIILNKISLQFEHHNTIDNPMGNYAVIHSGLCTLSH